MKIVIASVGWGMVATGLATVLTIPLFFWQAQVGAQHLLRIEEKVQSTLHHEQVNSTAKHMAGQRHVGSLKGNLEGISTGSRTVGTLIGIVSIPSIHLKAPIVEGTGSWQLRNAVGHLTGSSIPGQGGTGILAAHNVTLFREIGKLQKGDRIQIATNGRIYSYRVYGQQLVYTGHLLSSTHFSSIALETCYPLSDLATTPWRYIVWAALE